MRLRLDRAATLLFFHPLRQFWKGRFTGIPLLMYHSISDFLSTRARAAYYETSTSPTVFAQHLRLLESLGYATIDVNEVSELLLSGSAIPPRTIAITFDDGYADFAETAWPVLTEHGFTATVYLPAGFISDTSGAFNGRRCMTWSQIRDLSDMGISFGSHTLSHPQLFTLSWPEIKRELRDSKIVIEDHLGKPVTSFAYPYAFPSAQHQFTEEIRSLLIEVGYTNGVCTEIGTACPSDDVFFLKRIPVNNWDDEKLFSAKLQHGYDWLQVVQHSSKAIRKLETSHH